MRRAMATVLICSLLAGEVLAVGRKKAVYVGGTIESFNKHKKAIEGELDLADEKTLIFKVKGQTIEVAYDRITALEYQNTAKGRPALASGAVGASVLGVVGAAATAGASLVLLPIALVAMPFVRTNRKHHFLTVIYKDADDKPQALVLELGKDIQRVTRVVIAARSGKEVKVIIEKK